MPLSEKHRKRLLWVFVALAVLILAIPSSSLLNAFWRYRNFLSGFEPALLKAVHVRFVAHGQAPDRRPKFRMRFVEFRLKAPKAKEVSLIGDFNGWRAGTLKLSRGRRGVWEIMLPLPPGSHHYLFMEDDKPVLDPRNKKSALYAGRPTSVIEIK